MLLSFLRQLLEFLLSRSSSFYSSFVYITSGNEEIIFYTDLIYLQFVFSAKKSIVIDSSWLIRC